MASGPRTCIFRVGGTIVLKSSIKIDNPYLTIAGQSAPGDGVQLKNGGFAADMLKVVTSDVVVRYITIRPGPNTKGDGTNLRCLGILHEQAHDVIVDHVSCSWATDEMVIVYGKPASDAAHRVTLQRSMLVEPLDCANHKDTLATGVCRAFALLAKRSFDISVHHNLFAHVRARAPLVSASDPRRSST